METKAPSRAPRLLIGAGLALTLLIGGRALVKHQARLAHEQRAAEQFAPVLEALEAPAAEASYDLDKTVQLIHEIDLAIEQSADLGAYLQTMARRDYRGVAPEVLGARRELMDVLFRIYSTQAEAEDQEAMWSLTSELMLGTLSVIGGEGEMGPLGPSGSLTVDREQARQLLEDLRSRQEARMDLGREQRELEAELIDSLVSYSEIYYRHLAEWDRLCTVRDRAYLAVYNGDWATAEAAASEAIRLAPHEREAHMLLAIALIESGKADQPEGAAQVEALLTDFIERHPDRTAPAFLLLGVLQARTGQPDAALLNLQQAAAYYPRQADALTDMLDPYTMRSFLRKTREGSYVIELYKATMLGAGYMSPDLQLARLAFDRGDFEGGRRKVLDHFSRRRTQEQWDFLLSDIEFSQTLLGADFRRIFPEDAWLDLQVKPTLLGSKLDVGVNNRSGQDLHNATLVLALQFTDMHADDYQTFVGGPTQPAVPKGKLTDFGTVEIRFELHGKPKTVADIVTHRAILVTDQAVLWVDTDEYKIALDEELRKGRAQPEDALARAAAVERSAPNASPRGVLERIAAEAEQGSLLSIDQNRLLKDGVVITLPRELAVLRPLFRLKYGDQVFTATENIIVDEHIQLRFDGVEDFDEQGGNQEIGLSASTVLGELQWTWSPESGNRFRLNQVGSL